MRSPLGDGQIRCCSRESNSDLLDSLASSHGTLGIVTLLEVDLIEAKPYVELLYQPVNLIGPMLERIWCEQQKPELDYIEAMMFSPVSGVIVLGRLRDFVKGKPQRFARAKDPYFYMHARDHMSTNSATPVIEFAPIEDYLIITTVMDSGWGKRFSSTSRYPSINGLPGR